MPGKSELILIHVKSNRKLADNDSPISIWPEITQVWRRFLDNCFFFFFFNLTQNVLLSPQQSGFKPGDSCINQFLSIFHSIYSWIDNDLRIIGVFIYISITFYKVWHDGLIHKLTCYSISGKLIQQTFWMKEKWVFSMAKFLLGKV